MSHQINKPAQDPVADGIVGFVSDAFRYGQALEELKLLYEFAVDLDNGLEPAVEIELLRKIEKLLRDGVERLRKQKESLTLDVPRILEFEEKGHGNRLDEIVDRLSERVGTFNQAQVFTGSVAPEPEIAMNQASSYDVALGGQYLNKLFDVELESNIGSVTTTTRSAERAEVAAAKLRALLSGGDDND